MFVIGHAMNMSRKILVILFNWYNIRAVDSCTRGKTFCDYYDTYTHTHVSVLCLKLVKLVVEVSLA